MDVTATRATQFNGGEEQQLKKLTGEFESILTHSMLKSMRQSGSFEGVLPAGNGREIFEDFRDMEIAKEISSGNGLGIGNALYKQLAKKYLNK